jgi:hypothetical protein
MEKKKVFLERERERERKHGLVLGLRKVKGE